VPTLCGMLGILGVMVVMGYRRRVVAYCCKGRKKPRRGVIRNEMGLESVFCDPENLSPAIMKPLPNEEIELYSQEPLPSTSSSSADSDNTYQCKKKEATVYGQKVKKK